MIAVLFDRFGCPEVLAQWSFPLLNPNPDKSGSPWPWAPSGPDRLAPAAHHRPAARTRQERGRPFRGRRCGHADGTTGPAVQRRTCLAEAPLCPRQAARPRTWAPRHRGVPLFDKAGVILDAGGAASSSTRLATGVIGFWLRLTLTAPRAAPNPPHHRQGPPRTREPLKARSKGRRQHDIPTPRPFASTPPPRHDQCDRAGRIPRRVGPVTTPPRCDDQRARPRSRRASPRCAQGSSGVRSPEVGLPLEPVDEHRRRPRVRRFRRPGRGRAVLDGRPGSGADACPGGTPEQEEAVDVVAERVQIPAGRGVLHLAVLGEQLEREATPAAARPMRPARQLRVAPPRPA
ncbi:hypothetical protein SAMN04487980_1015181 [Streptomyces sp. cf124]|nr:hypothetical protein SAMN04487980_1015181 [Streptomyces sp. cf124]